MKQSVCVLVLIAAFASALCAEDFDTAVQNTGNLIHQRLNQLPAGSRVRVGDFLLDGEQGQFGEMWKWQLSTALSGMQSRNYVLVDPAGMSTYVISGTALRSDQGIRIYTQLVQESAGSVDRAWTSNVDIDSFVQSLIQTGRSSSRFVSPDSYEPDSSDAPVQTPLNGTWISRTIHNGDEDWFDVGVPGNQLLIVETDGNIDTYMELYDDRLNLLSENDDFGESLNARIDYPAESGTHYIIKVKGLSESDVGSYRFRASVTAFSDRDEPNDRQNQATLLTPDSSHTGYFSSATDVDWYRVQMPSKGGVLTAYVNGSSRSDLSIVDQTGQIVKNSGGSSYISAIVPGGTIYLQLKERNNWRGRYEISVEIYDAQPLDRYEPDDDMNSAGEIFMDVSQQHTFSYSGDVDWVRFTVSRAGAYEIRTMGINRDVDTYIELFDSRGNSVAEDDDGGENLDSRLQIQLRPGTYFLKVAAYEEDPVNQSDYEISVAPVRF